MTILTFEKSKRFVPKLVPEHVPAPWHEAVSFFRSAPRAGTAPEAGFGDGKRNGAAPSIGVGGFEAPVRAGNG